MQQLQPKTGMPQPVLPQSPHPTRLRKGSTELRYNQALRFKNSINDSTRSKLEGMHHQRILRHLQFQQWSIAIYLSNLRFVIFE